MKVQQKSGLAIVLIVVGLALAVVAKAGAQGISQQEDIIRGAILYDNWFAALGVDAPPGDMPIWSRQSTNTRSGPNTWRCVECHGWDYRGAQGAYASGSHYTGFPDVMFLTQQMTEADIVAHLKGAKDPAHDFSPYLDETSIRQLAAFLKRGLIDDSLYIDAVSLKVIGGDVDHGQRLYQSVCAACHGEDGTKIVFRSEGVNEYLGTVAARDPWRFLHRTRFGVAGDRDAGRRDPGLAALRRARCAGLRPDPAHRAGGDLPRPGLGGGRTGAADRRSGHELVDRHPDRPGIVPGCVGLRHPVHRRLCPGWLCGGHHPSQAEIEEFSCWSASNNATCPQPSAG